MKRIRIPWLLDIVLSDDPAEIKSLAQDSKLDRAYADRSVLVNGRIIQRIRHTLQIGGQPFPTVAPKCAAGRSEAQDALWNRLNLIAPAYTAGPAELESLAAFVRGDGSTDDCGPLAQQVVGRLFVPSFTATPTSWNAALVLDKAPRSMNPVLLAWWTMTGKVDQAKKLLSDMVGGDLAAVHAIGVAVHNIVNGVNLMRRLYTDPAGRTSITPESAATQCLVAPEKVLRQPTSPADSSEGLLRTGTIVILNLQAANAKSPDTNVAFLRQSWSRCPAEQWVPALLQGIWRRARESPSP